MESSAVYAEVQGDSVVITTDTGRKVTIELEPGEGDVLARRHDDHLMGDMVELVFSTVLAVDAMIAAPNERTVCVINHAFADAAVQATEALLAAYPPAQSDDEREVEDPEYDYPDTAVPGPDDDRDAADDAFGMSPVLLLNLLGPSPSLGLVHRTASGFLVVEQP
jgi:hypothetical protein